MLIGYLPVIFALTLPLAAQAQTPVLESVTTSLPGDARERENCYIFDQDASPNPYTAPTCYIYGDAIEIEATFSSVGTQTIGNLTIEVQQLPDGPNAPYAPKDELTVDGTRDDEDGRKIVTYTYPVSYGDMALDGIRVTQFALANGTAFPLNTPVLPDTVVPVNGWNNHSRISVSAGEIVGSNMEFTIRSSSSHQISGDLNHYLVLDFETRDGSGDDGARAGVDYQETMGSVVFRAGAAGAVGEACLYTGSETQDHAATCNDGMEVNGGVEVKVQVPIIDAARRTDPGMMTLAITGQRIRNWSTSNNSFLDTERGRIDNMRGLTPEHLDDSGQGTGTLPANAARLSFMGVPTIEVRESEQEIVLTVTANQEQEMAMEVEYQTDDQPGAEGIAGVDVDYDSTSGTLTIEPMMTVATITVGLNPDDVSEQNETFIVSLGTAVSNNVIVSGTEGAITVRIIDDDAPTLTFALVEGAQDPTFTGDEQVGNGVVVFTVELNPVSDVRVTVGYTTSPGSAEENLPGRVGDFVPVPTGRAPLEIAAGASVGLISITIPDDNVYEPGDETFTVTLDSPSGGANLGASRLITATGIIQDDDVAPAGVRLSTNPISLPEGNATRDIVVTAELVNARDMTSTVVFPVDLELIITVGRSGDTAQAGGIDFDDVNPFGITIRAGRTSGDGSFALTIEEDQLAEVDEIFTVHTTTAATAYDLRVIDALFTIRDNDAVGMVFTTEEGAALPSQLVVLENDSFVYAVALSSRPAADVVVAITHGSEVSITPGRLTFTTENWQTPVFVTVVGIDDDDYQDERLTVTQTASGTANYDALAPHEYIIVVRDDDVPGVLVEPNTLMMDENGTATYTLSLRSAPDAEVTLSPSLQPEYDLSVSPDTFMFTAENWRSPQTVTVTASDDTDGEDETIAMTHALTSEDADYNPGQGRVPRSELLITIEVTDDDPRSFRARPSSLSMVEGGVATYSVELVTQPQGDVALRPTVSGEDADQITFGNQVLIYVDSTWNIAQTLTITSNHDDDPLNETITIMHSASSEDGGYETAASRFVVEVVVLDDDTPRMISAAVTDESLLVSGGTYGVGEEIQLVAVFSRPVLVTGAPKLRFMIGGKERTATYEPLPPSTGRDDATEGSARLVFSYVVQGDDRVGEDGVMIVAGQALELGQGVVIADASEPTVSAQRETGADFKDEVALSDIDIDGTDDRLLRAVVALHGEPVEGRVITLDGGGTRSGDDRVHLAYAWRQAEDDELQVRILGADQDVATFATPNIRAGVRLNFVLDVTNTRTGDKSSDEVTVAISAVNDAPVANAGLDQRVDEGASVTLDGSGSTDPEQEEIVYSWRQTQGVPVSLGAVDTVNPTFTAPSNLTRASEPLEFELTVTDPGEASHTDVVVVTVRNVDVNDVLEQALSRVGRTLASSTVDAIGERFSRIETSIGDLFGISLNGVQIWDGDGIRVGGLPTLMGLGLAGLGPTADAAQGGGGETYASHFANRHFADRLRTTPTSRLARLFDMNALDVESFELAFGGEFDAEPRWMAWGRTEHQGFEGRHGTGLDMEGAASSNYLGVDRRIGETAIIGLALSSADSTVDYANGIDDETTTGKVQVRLVGITPYGRLSFSDRFGVWGLYGTGNGRAEITVDPYRAPTQEEPQDDAPAHAGDGEGTEIIDRTGTHQETDVGMRLLSAGANAGLGNLFGIDWAARGDVLSVTMSSDESGLLDPLDTSSRRMRVGLEGSGLWEAWGGLELQPSLGLAARYDSGDAEGGYGMEMSGGVAFADPEIGFGVDLRIRGLVFHDNADIKDWGGSLSVYLNPGDDGGFAFSLAPSWGQTMSRAEALWQAEYLSNVEFAAAPRLTSPSGRMNAELSYAFHGTRWGLSPYGALRANADTDRLRMGLRLKALNMKSGKLSIDVFDEQAFGLGLQGTLHRVLR